MQESRAAAIGAPNHAGHEAANDPAPLFVAPKERFLEFRLQPTSQRAWMLGTLGALGFFGLWELGHYLTAESARKFLPSVEQVARALYVLFSERNFLHDVLISCYRIFVSFFAASAVGVPIGILMGCFGNVRALLNPTLSGWRYLPAASFIPLLLVWFGPTDLAKIALLFIGVIFFLISLILDNTRAVPKELVEAALTMGASRRQRHNYLGNPADTVGKVPDNATQPSCSGGSIQHAQQFRGHGVFATDEIDRLVGDRVARPDRSRRQTCRALSPWTPQAIRDRAPVCLFRDKNATF